jgi:long-chain acyl-CoA synthetase
VVGPERKFVSALIVPSFSNLKEWCRKNGVPFTSNNEVIQNSKVIGMYKELVESFNKYFSHTEQVKKFVLLPEEWSIETGEMTPKLSLKRKVITEKYRDEIEKIYA